MSEQNAGTGGTQDHPSGDSRVRGILDRVAAGQLSSEEAAILLAAMTTPTPEPRHAAEPDQVAASDQAKESGEAGSEQPGGSAEADAKADADEADEPSGDVWAAAVAATGVPADEAAGVSTGGAGGGSEVDEPVEVEYSRLPAPSGVQRVTIRAIGRRVRLIGEPAIAGVAVDGPHLIKRDGDTLAISSEGDMGVSLDGFSVLRTRSVGDLRSQVVGGIAKELAVRVNPSLRVEVEVTGGSVSAERLPNLTKVRVTAGTAKVADVDGPIDLLVQAGSATLDAQLTKGRSRVRVESGAANVTLRRGSDVRVHSEAQLGKVSWTGAVSGNSTDVEIGRGRATLDVEVLVGAAQIASD